MRSGDGKELTLGRFLEEIARTHKGQRAIVFESREWAYDDLDRESRALARGLVAAGVVKGTRVAVLLSNRPEFILAMFAIGLVGGVMVPVSTFANREERDYILRHSDAALLLVQKGLLRHEYVDDLLEAYPEIADGTAGRLRVAALPQLRRVVALGLEAPRGGVETWQSLLDGGDDVPASLIDAIRDEVEPSDDAVIVYTSGSTANPKGVLHMHRAPVLQGWRFGELLGYDAGDRVYTCYPFFWGAGIAMSIGAVLSTGGCLLLQETFEPGAALELMEAERATALQAWPHQQSAIAEHPTAAARDLSQMKKIEASGPVGKLLGFPKDNYGVGSSYGLSETFTVASMNHTSAPARLRHSTTGKPLPGMKFLIVDPDTGEPLPTGQPGEIAIKGVSFMRGYYKTLPEDVLDANGYFRTSDGGSFDEEGFLHWTGRLSTIIKTGGANVSPSEIEKAVANCPGVHTGVALGLDHPTLGEVIVLCVTPNEGATVDEDDVRSFLREKLSAYKVPKRVLVFEDEDLSYTGNQKVQVAPVRKLAVERLAREGAVIEGHSFAGDASA